MNLLGRFWRSLILGLRADRADVRSGRRHRPVFWMCGVLLGLALSALAACTTHASGHIQVVRSVFLERGQSVEPHALTRTRDGGYVIAGRLAGFPWATRVNAQGKMEWRYLAPVVLPKAGEPAGDSMFTGAVTLPDDSTLLCGYGSHGLTRITGLLTRLSTHGRVLSTQTLYPNDDHHYILNYLDRCVRWGKGVAVVGSTTLFQKNGTRNIEKNYVWLIKLDGQGKIQWEKLILDPYAKLNPDQTLLALSNSDLVVMTDRAELRLIGPDGTLRAKRTIPFAMVVPSTGPEQAVHVVAGGKHITPAWLTLGDHLQDTQAVPLSARPVEIIPYKKAYRLSNGALALFGDTTPRKYGGMLISSIAWISPHFGRKQVYTFKPWSIWIADAVPTGKPGDFATVREVSSLRHPFDRNRMGIMLDFVHIQ